MLFKKKRRSPAPDAPMVTANPTKITLSIREDVPVSEVESAMRIFAESVGSANFGTPAGNAILWSQNKYNCGYIEVEDIP